MNLHHTLATNFPIHSRYNQKSESLNKSDCIKEQVVVFTEEAGCHDIFQSQQSHFKEATTPGWKKKMLCLISGSASFEGSGLWVFQRDFVNLISCCWWSTPRNVIIFSLSFFFFGPAKKLGICEATKNRSSAFSKNREKKEHLEEPSDWDSLHAALWRNCPCSLSCNTIVSWSNITSTDISDVLIYQMFTLTSDVFQWFPAHNCMLSSVVNTFIADFPSGFFFILLSFWGFGKQSISAAICYQGQLWLQTADSMVDHGKLKKEGRVVTESCFGGRSCSDGCVEVNGTCMEKHTNTRHIYVVWLLIKTVMTLEFICELPSKWECNVVA